MSKKIFKSFKILLFLIVVALTIGSIYKPSDISGSFRGIEVSAANEQDYYEPVRGLYGDELKEGLYQLIKGHKMFGYSSANESLKIIDADPNNSNNIVFIYTGSTSKSTSFNKEHVWAKSHGDFGTSMGAGSDLHNLRPCYNSLNSTRSNYDFANGGTEISNYPGNKLGSVGGVKTFEPSDEFKGDVARIIFYMATRYEGTETVNGSTYSFPDLELRNYAGTGTAPYHGVLDDLLEWNLFDDVSEYETSRNDIVYERYQKNRNPFIDHPEFAIMIYDESYSGSGALNDLNGTEKTSVADLIKEIDAISQETITLDLITRIEKCEDNYNRLTDAEKAEVTNYHLLENVRIEYEKLYEETLVNNVIQKIADIGEVTLSSKQKIDSALEEYEKLSKDAQAKVTNKNTLINAQAIYNCLAMNSSKSGYKGDFANATGAKSQYASYTVTLNNQKWYASNLYFASGEFRFGYNKVETLPAKYGSQSGSYLEMQWSCLSSLGIVFTKDSYSYDGITGWEIYSSVDDGLTYSKVASGKVSDEIKYDEPTAKANVRYTLVILGEKARLSLKSVEILEVDSSTNNEAVLEVVNLIASITEVTSETRDVLNTIISKYDLLDETQKSLVLNYSLYEEYKETLDALLSDEEKFQVEIDNVIILISNLGEITLEKYAQLNNCVDAYNSLTDEQKALVTNYGTLVSAQRQYIILDNQAKADQVSNLINNIGEVFLDKEQLILDCVAAYNSLTDEQKALVTNYSTLLSAQSEYEQLANMYKEAKEVIDQINAIGEVSLDKEQLIFDCVAAYNNLTDEQKALVTNYSTLLSAQSEYEQLESKYKEAKEVIDQINAIGEVSLDKEQLILDCVAAYNNLTEEQKALISNYEALVNANTFVQGLKKYNQNKASLLPGIDTVYVNDTWVDEKINLNSDFTYLTKGSPSTKEVGSYIVEYEIYYQNIYITTLKRVVNVLEKQEEENVEINIEDTICTITKDSLFEIPKASVDGNEVSDVAGIVNVSEPGIYKLEYTYSETKKILFITVLADYQSSINEQQLQEYYYVEVKKDEE